MADVIALCAALTQMGFGPACVTFITDTQGMNNLEEFRLLDDDAVQTLCKAIRRPGRMMDNPAFAAGGGTAAAAASGIPELLEFYVRPMRKPNVGARFAKLLFNIDLYDKAGCCARNRECPLRSRLGH